MLSVTLTNLKIAESALSCLPCQTHNCVHTVNLQQHVSPGLSLYCNPLLLKQLDAVSTSSILPPQSASSKAQALLLVLPSDTQAHIFCFTWQFQLDGFAQAQHYPTPMDKRGLLFFPENHSLCKISSTPLTTEPDWNIKLSTVAYHKHTGKGFYVVHFAPI